MNHRASWLAWLPAMLAIALFLPVLGGAFVYDDLILLENNPALDHWSYLTESFTQPMWDMVDDARYRAGGFFRPVSTSLFLLLHKLGGGTPWPFHLAAILLHATAALLVARLALSVGGTPRLATFAGLLFAVHGAHAEPLAWASSLTYPLATCLALGSILALCRHKASRAAFLVGLAMLAQESALGIWALLVGTIFVTWISPKGKLKRGLHGRSLIWLLAPLFAVWALRAQAFDSPWAGMDQRLTWFGLELREHPFWEEAALSASLFTRGLEFLVFPWPHAPFHPLRIEWGLGDSARFLPALAGAALATVGIWAWFTRGRKMPLLGWAIGILLAGFLPLLRSSSLGQFPFEERFLYLPSVGFCLLVAAAWARLPQKWWATLLVPSLLLGAHGTSAFLGARPWGQEESLFRWAAEASPHAMLSHNELGRVLLTKAQKLPEGSPERTALGEEALASYERSLKLDPDIWFISAVDRRQGNLGLGDSMFVLSDFGTAQGVYRKILTRWPDTAEAHAGLARCLVLQAEQHLGKGMLSEADSELTEAISAFDQALAITPGQIEMIFGKGLALADLQRFAEASPLLRQAFQSNPSEYRFTEALAAALFEDRRFAAARTVLAEHLAAHGNCPRRGDILTTMQQLQQQ